METNTISSSTLIEQKITCNMVTCKSNSPVIKINYRYAAITQDGEVYREVSFSEYMQKLSVREIEPINVTISAKTAEFLENPEMLHKYSIIQKTIIHTQGGSISSYPLHELTGKLDLEMYVSACKSSNFNFEKYQKSHEECGKLRNEKVQLLKEIDLLKGKKINGFQIPSSMLKKDGTIDTRKKIGELLNNLLNGDKVRPNYAAGSGAHSSIATYMPNFMSLLNDLKIPSLSGNDAARGGKIGEWVVLRKK